MKPRFKWNTYRAPISALHKNPVAKAVQGQQLTWDLPSQEFALIEAIVKRCNLHALEMGAATIDPMIAKMDLATVHCHDAKLDLMRMHTCPDVIDVMQAVAGIGLHIDRKTGKLKNGYRTKFHVAAN